MRNAFLLLIICITSCKDSSITNRTIKLNDHLGTVSVDLPNEFCAFHKWVSTDCTMNGDEVYYRWQASNYPMTQETSDFIWPDSILAFTLIHNRLHRDGIANGSSSGELGRGFLNLMKLNNPRVITIEVDSLTNLFGQRFCFFISSDSITQALKKSMSVSPLKTKEYKLSAFTVYNGVAFKFIFQAPSCLNSKRDFEEKAIEILRTIHFTN